MSLKPDKAPPTTQDRRFNDEVAKMIRRMKRVSFTPSDLTPTAGTVTGTNKDGNYQYLGDGIQFEIAWVGYTQNTAASGNYTFTLPIIGAGLTRRVFNAWDANTGDLLSAVTNGSNTIVTVRRIGSVNWGIAAGVNIFVSGFLFYK